jgi:hypothetical protein
LCNRSTSASTTGHTIPDPPFGGQEQRERRSFERREQVGVVSECHRKAMLDQGVTDGPRYQVCCTIR